MPPSPQNFHPTSIVEPDAEVGAGTKIWHHAHVRTGAVVGRDCTISKNVFVDTSASVGDRCKIQNNVSLYAGVALEDDVFVGPSVVFTNDRIPRATSTQWRIEKTLVKAGASIGANATIICGVTIGPHSMVGAGSVVTRSVPAYGRVVGNPARQIGWVCVCGRSVASRPTEPMCRCDDLPPGGRS